MDAFDAILAMKDDLPFAPVLPQPVLPVMPAAHDGGNLRGSFSDVGALLRFITAGNATLTIVSRRTSERRTYRFKRPDPQPGRDRPIWVSLLSGPDNESDYAFLGTIWESPNGLSYRHSAKSRTGAGSPAVVGVIWLARALNNARPDIFERAEFWHEGRCGRCGRKLTVPASVESGFGPECSARVGGA